MESRGSTDPADVGAAASSGVTGSFDNVDDGVSYCCRSNGCEVIEVVGTWRTKGPEEDLF